MKTMVLMALRENAAARPFERNGFMRRGARGSQRQVVVDQQRRVVAEALAEIDVLAASARGSRRRGQLNVDAPADVVGPGPAALAAGFAPMSLGPRVLRAETAALAALTLLSS